MRVALYARVSTTDKGQNPDMQLDALRKYCESMGWEIVKEYVDLAGANDFTNRKQWTQLMKDASLHKFDRLLVWKLDRAFRSVIHANNTVLMLDAYHVIFQSLTDNLTFDKNSPMGVFIFQIFAAAAELEKSTIILRVNEGLTYAKNHGTKSQRELGKDKGKAIGRPSNPITLQSICSAVYSAKGNYHEASRILTELEKQKISDGLISLRLKRAGIAKNDILQNPDQYFEFSQAHF